MPEAISNTSPLLYLYRVDALSWLREIFGGVWIPSAVVAELEQGRRRGSGVPDPTAHDWVRIVDPRLTPSEWLALDLGAGELATI